MSNVSKRKKDSSRPRMRSMGDHKEFLKRITKTLYYGQLPSLPCISLPVTEISCEAWSLCQRGRSVRRLHVDSAADLTRQACVSPCALVLALIYLERLNACNPDYLANVPPADLFLVSLMVGNKFLQDDGEDDEVFVSEWATSGGMELEYLKQLEIEFLTAIEWNIFVNEKTFEGGLSRLERKVALKQGLLRGFFTYSDLVACEGSAGNVLEGAWAAGAALLASYLAAVATLLTSALVVAQLSALLRLAPTALDSSRTSPATRSTPAYHGYVNNSTQDTEAGQEILDRLLEPSSCCSKWQKHRDDTELLTQKRSWYDAMVTSDWKLELWWTSSAIDWLYRSAPIDPMQRWLEKIDGYADLWSMDLNLYPKPVYDCHDYIKKGEPQHCVRQWLNLSKLTALVVSVSDR